MMAVRLAVAALFGALVLAGALAPQTAQHAAACSFARVTLDDAATHAKMAILGEVTDEEYLGEPGHGHPYKSTVRVVATLKGDAPRELTLNPLGFLGSDCSGGPRLREGERVLLFLSPWRGDLTIWGYTQGKYVLASGMAETASGLPIPVEEAIRRVATITGAPQDQLDAALAFALGGPLPASDPELEPLSQPEPPQPASAQPEVISDDGGRPVLLIALASLGLLLLTGALFALRFRRAR